MLLISCLVCVSILFHSLESSCVWLFFFFKQKTAYEMLISDWSSDVCSSDLYISPRGLLVHDTGVAMQILSGLSVDVYKNPASTQSGRASCRERACQYV